MNRKYLEHGWDRLETFKILEKGWEFHGKGEPLQPYSLENFNHFMDALEENIFYEVPSIFMDLDGTVTLEWNVKELSLEIEFKKEYELWIDDEKINYTKPLDLINKIKEIK